MECFLYIYKKNEEPAYVYQFLNSYINVHLEPGATRGTINANRYELYSIEDTIVKLLALACKLKFLLLRMVCSKSNIYTEAYWCLFI
jgi:hypothetical protein